MNYIGALVNKVLCHHDHVNLVRLQSAAIVFKGKFSFFFTSLTWVLYLGLAISLIELPQLKYVTSVYLHLSQNSR